MGPLQSTQSMCKFQAIDDCTFYILISQFITELIICLVFLYSLKLRRQHDKPIEKDQKSIATLICLWCTLSILRSTTGIIMYKFLQDNSLRDGVKYTISSIFQLLTQTSAYIVHSLLFLITLIWVFNILQTIDGQTDQECLKITKIYRNIKRIRIYTKFRIIWVIVFAVSELIFYNKKYSTYFLIFITSFEALLILATYTYGLVKIRLYLHLSLIQPAFMRQMLKQYLVLWICSIGKVIFYGILFYLIMITEQIIFTPQCRWSEETKQIYITLWKIYYFPGYYISHYLPIVSIINFYWPSDKGLFMTLNSADDHSQVSSNVFGFLMKR